MHCTIRISQKDNTKKSHFTSTLSLSSPDLPSHLLWPNPLSRPYLLWHDQLPWRGEGGGSGDVRREAAVAALACKGKARRWFLRTEVRLAKGRSARRWSLRAEVGDNDSVGMRTKAAAACEGRAQRWRQCTKGGAAMGPAQGGRWGGQRTKGGGKHGQWCADMWREGVAARQHSEGVLYFSINSITIKKNKKIQITPSTNMAVRITASF